MTARFAFSTPLLLSLALLGLAAPGAALADSHEAGEKAAPQVMEWDQAAVTAIAERLAGVTTELRAVARKNATTRTGAGTVARSEIQDGLRRLQGETRRYRDNLQAGKGRDETRTQYQRIGQLHRDLEERGQRIMIQENAKGSVTDLRTELAALAPYYAK